MKQFETIRRIRFYDKKVEIVITLTHTSKMSLQERYVVISKVFLSWFWWEIFVVRNTI